MKKTMLLTIVAFIATIGFAQPSGTVMAYAGTKESLAKLQLQGWIVCDGALYDRTKTKYLRLFAAIGTSWGGDTGNQFAVPDLRGMFLRGVADNSGNDPDVIQRVSPRPDLDKSGNEGNKVGSTQSDAFRVHHHSYNSKKGRADGGDVYWGYGFENNSNLPDNKNYDLTDVGGNETRPKNAYVYYIIKL
jgi:hypothetical protein